MSYRTSFRGIVYIGRENTLVMTVQEHDPVAGTTVDVAWAGVTRMVLVLLEVTQGVAGDVVAIVDTDLDPGLIDYSVDGQLTLKLGDILDVDGNAMTEKVCAMRLTAYEGVADSEIIHESSHDATVQFVATGS